MQLLWTALGGLLVGLLGLLAVPGLRLPALLSPLLGLGGALAGNTLAAAVLGPDHRTVDLVAALVVAAIAVSGLAGYLRTRAFA
ncbi:MAG TPA: hypothetical protein VFN97_24645 [Actinospica sp.]|nr:hypothetical protein [Actinospica sp.]